MVINCFFVGLGGFSGAVLRYLLSLLPVGENTLFPIQTLIINILGALVIGILSELAGYRNMISPKSILFLKTGLCGGFTTFSTFSLESITLLSEGHSFMSITYMILSVVFCLAAVFAGKMIVVALCN